MSTYLYLQHVKTLKASDWHPLITVKEFVMLPSQHQLADIPLHTEHDNPDQ